ncbi:mitochondrial 54S ribosomal protein mL38 [Aspergillus ibericus CBS 121593]|uniref:PEBP-like protein n=1 Tax=Aspergillus ibericus CBS 121593 TaxID=1448316 RepID=A0A395H475_9EURO|nr:PEBP-like protein [Aspergillus ibericus CBS 121593]RAL01024.1 PEBP-like protein [Aspergillus ibericus CBS 121593]
MQFLSILTSSFLAIGLTAASTPSSFTPSVEADVGVIFSADGSQLTLTAGTLISQNWTTDAPTLYLEDTTSTDGQYTIIMIDPTINEDGVLTTALHWYQPYLAYSSGVLEISNTSAPSAEYVYPTPLEGPAHDYILLLYSQPEDYSLPVCLESLLPATDAARLGFDLDEFEEVTGLGTPVAANWFQVVNPTPASTTYAITSTLVATYACEATATATASS